VVLGQASPNYLSLQVGLKFYFIVTYFGIEVIIIISPLQSTVGHRLLKLLAISLDFRLLASSSYQPFCANRDCA
jgi:hypothetical protein